PLQHALPIWIAARDRRRASDGRPRRRQGTEADGAAAAQRHGVAVEPPGVRRRRRNTSSARREPRAARRSDRAGHDGQRGLLLRGAACAGGGGASRVDTDVVPGRRAESARGGAARVRRAVLLAGDRHGATGRVGVARAVAAGSRGPAQLRGVGDGGRPLPRGDRTPVRHQTQREYVAAQRRRGRRTTRPRPGLGAGGDARYLPRPHARGRARARLAGRLTRAGTRARTEGLPMPKIIGNSLGEHREQVRARVFDALRNQLYERGFEAITLAGVAAEAGVGRTAMYNHFPDREHLLVAFVEDEAARYVARLTEAVDAVDDPADKLAAFARLQLTTLAEYHIPPGTTLARTLAPSAYRRIAAHADPI